MKLLSSITFQFVKMRSAASAIIQNLDNSARYALAVSLADNVEKDRSNLTALCSVIEMLDVDNADKIYVQLIPYIRNVLNASEAAHPNQIDDIRRLFKLIPKLYLFFLQQVELSLMAYIQESKREFQIAFEDIIVEQMLSQKFCLEDKKLIDDNHIVYLLDILESTWRDEPQVESPSSKVHILLCILLGSLHEEIQNSVTKALEWRCQYISENLHELKLLWKVIFLLGEANHANFENLSFVLWLRYLGSMRNVKTENDNYFVENIMSSEKYWSLIQKGIASNSHEHRKYSLAILELSIISVRSSFKNEVFFWESDRQVEFEYEWKRYITLLRIIAIDTSLHQAEAGIQTFFKTLSPESLIHPSWAYCLLAAGFKATMDSVRKFCLSILLSIPTESLQTLTFGRKYLEDVFLPYAMLASHFSVQELESYGLLTCNYSQELRSFVSNLIRGLSNEDDVLEFARSILLVVNRSKDSFEPSRIYVTIGLLEGIGNRLVLEFNIHGAMMSSIFESKCESELFEIVTQTINFRLLEKFKWSSVRDFFELIRKFVKVNGYQIFFSSMETILKYLSTVHISISVIIDFFNEVDDMEFKFLSLCLIFSLKDPIVKDLLSGNETVTDVLIIRSFSMSLPLMAQDQDLKTKIHSILSEAISRNDAILLHYISDVDAGVFLSLPFGTIDLCELWTQINVDVQSNQVKTLCASLDKLKIFNSLISGNFNYSKKLQEISIDQLILFENSVFINSKELMRTHRDLYKLREEILGQYYLIIYNRVSKEDAMMVEDMIDILDYNCFTLDTNLALVKLLRKFLDFDVAWPTSKKIIFCICDLWDSVEDHRLQLNQKELHISLIRLIFHDLVLGAAVKDIDISERLYKISLSIIKNSEGRRCLLPSFTNCLSHFQVNQRDHFESIEWMPEILVKAFTVLQLRSNAFQLVKVIGNLYDNSLSSNAEEPIYHSIYGADEITFRINLLAIFNSNVSQEFSERIFHYVFDDDFGLETFIIKKNTDGLEERKRINLFTIIISLMDRLNSGKTLDSAFRKAIEILIAEPSPLVRIYIEWFVSFYVSKNEGEMKKMLSQMISMLKDVDKPVVIASYERILYLAIQNLSMDKKTQYVSTFIKVVLPGATSNKAVIRHFTVSLIYSISIAVRKDNLKIEPALVEIVHSIYEGLVKSNSSEQYRSGDALLWDIHEDLNLVNLSGAILLKVSDREFRYISKKAFVSLLSHEQKAVLCHPIGEEGEDALIGSRKVPKQKTLQKISFHGHEVQSPLQVKDMTWNNVIKMTGSNSTLSIKRSKLIVVASLVDKPPNLGGICRLCDVLGVGMLTIHDIKVKTNAQFRSVAVTADQWMPMEELRQADIINYLIEKRRQGYTLIGLEQTDRSLVLRKDLKFPEKSLILLGKEKEGIPGELLAELDFCIEIKQVGVVRSMNIQTATAVIVHAYSSQFC